MEALCRFFHSMPWCRDRAWLGWGQGEGGEKAVSQLVGAPGGRSRGPVLSLCPSADWPLGTLNSPGWLPVLPGGVEVEKRMCWPGGTERAQVACLLPLHPGQAAPSGDLGMGTGPGGHHPSLPETCASRTLQASWAPLPAAFPVSDPARHYLQFS